jgi:hypothetical protein
LFLIILNSHFILVAPASFAQTRILTDDRTCLHPDQSLAAMHNMPFLYRLCSKHVLSTTRLRHALQLIITKHQSLCTSIVLDTENNLFMQRLIDFTDNKKEQFRFVESTFATEEQFNNIVHDEQRNSEHFDLTRGVVFRCHILYYKQMSTDNLVSDKDAIIFNFHHAAFDFQSMNLFLNDLHQACATGQLGTNDNADLRYLDCNYRYFYDFLL